MTKKKKKTLKLKDPMVLILAVLFLFITGGTAIKAAVFGGRTEVIVMLDAAYGEEAKGNSGVINEADYNAALVKELAEVLKKDNRFIVKLSHEEGAKATIHDRAAAADKENPELLLSIHCGYNPAKTVSGMKIYADVPGSKTNSKSLEAAQKIKETFAAENAEVLYRYYEPLDEKTFQVVNVSAEGSETKELKTWSLMEEASVPVVIVEQFNVANEEAAAKYNTEEGIKATAQQYYKALLAVFKLN